MSANSYLSIANIIRRLKHLLTRYLQTCGRQVCSLRKDESNKKFWLPLITVAASDLQINYELCVSQNQFWNSERWSNPGDWNCIERKKHTQLLQQHLKLSAFVSKSVQNSGVVSLQQQFHFHKKSCNSKFQSNSRATIPTADTMADTKD